MHWYTFWLIVFGHLTITHHVFFDHPITDVVPLRFSRFCIMAMGFDHSTESAVARSDTDAGRRVLACRLYFNSVFRGVEARALCRTLESLYTNFGRQYLHGLSFFAQNHYHV